jgi:hypothetical protein
MSISLRKATGNGLSHCCQSFGLILLPDEEYMKHTKMSWHKQEETPGHRGKKNDTYSFRGPHRHFSKEVFCHPTSDSGSNASYKAKGKFKMQVSAIHFHIRMVYKAAAAAAAAGSSSFFV